MTDLDPMDRLLREYADRWRDSAAQAPSVDHDRLGARRGTRRTWWLVAASAAAVAVVIAGGTRLVGDENTTKPRPADTTKPRVTVVPWAPLPATHPQIPTTTTTPSPDPAEAAGKPECRASDLHATSQPGVAAGTYSLNVRLVLVGGDPCRLEGYPELEPLDGGRPVAIPLEHQTDDSVYRDPVLVADKQPALLRLSWTSDWCATPVQNDTIRMALAGGGSLTFEGLGGSQCYGVPGSGSRSPIVVSTFQPVKAREGEARSAYAGVDVSGNLDLTAAPGDPIEFTITLTSPRDLVLDPCPDFRIIQSTNGRPHEESYALNCAAVPYKDDSGRPFLPAGTPVRFAMHTSAGDTGRQKLSWVLDTVDVNGTSGTLTVDEASQPSAGPQTRDDALRRALEADPAVRREMLLAEPQGQFLCSFHVLGSSPSGDTFYLWLSCSDFVVADGAATNRSGSSEPAVVQLRGSGMDLRVEKVTFPRQQSLDADIKRLFPPSIANRIYDEESTRTSPSEKELEAEAVRNAAG